MYKRSEFTIKKFYDGMVTAFTSTTAQERAEKESASFQKGFQAGLNFKSEPFNKPIAKGDECIVFDRYRFAFPLLCVVVDMSNSNDEVKVKLLKSNNGFYPVGCYIWVDKEQLKIKVSD